MRKYRIEPAVFGWALLVYISFLVPILAGLALDKDKTIFSMLYSIGFATYLVPIIFLVRNQIWAKWLIFVTSTIMLGLTVVEYNSIFNYYHTTPWDINFLIPISILVILICSVFIKDIPKLPFESSVENNELPSTFGFMLPINVVAILIIFPFIGPNILILVAIILLALINIGIISFLNLIKILKTKHDFINALKIMFPVILGLFVVRILHSFAIIMYGGDEGMGGLLLFGFYLLSILPSLIILIIGYLIIRPYELNNPTSSP